MALVPARAQRRGDVPEGVGTGRAAAVQGNSYRLGARTVVIPPPAGFAEAFTQSEYISQVLTATESPANEVLTAHVPVEDLNRLKRGEQVGFDFYTKVSVLKAVKTEEMSEAEFSRLVARIEPAFSQMLDINSPNMKSAVRNLRDGLSSVAGQDVQVDLEQPQNLGFFEKTKDVYSAMLLMVLKGPGGKLPLLAGLSFLRVNNRLLFVYTYRKFTSEKDAEVLRDFTREWVRRIIAANR